LLLVAGPEIGMNRKKMALKQDHGIGGIRVEDDGLALLCCVKVERRLPAKQLIAPLVDEYYWSVDDALRLGISPLGASKRAGHPDKVSVRPFVVRIQEHSIAAVGPSHASVVSVRHSYIGANVIASGEGSQGSRTGSDQVHRFIRTATVHENDFHAARRKVWDVPLQ